MTSTFTHARARIIGQERGFYEIRLATGETSLAVVSGSFRHDAFGKEDFPAVGDWVSASGGGDHDHALIHAIEPRQTCLVRKSAGTAREAQILAANVDTAFIVTSANQDLNLRRIERYLSLVWDGGARPVILVTKAELSDSIEAVIAEIETVAMGVDVHAVSAHAGAGFDALGPYLLPGATVVLLGSSGVGKSTLANHLLGEARLLVQEVREHDDRGKHTTTSRYLFALPGGAFLIDTPGMRELQLDGHDEGLQTTYADVEEFMRECRFTNCAHRTEPGCGILHALEAGALAPDRWEAYQKLEREISFHRRKEDPVEMARERERWKKLGAAGRANMRRKRGLD